MPGRGRPPKKGISPKGVPLANRQSRLQSQSPIASRNGDIRSMFSRQAAKKNKSPPPPDADAASPAPVAKRARRDATPEAFVDGVLKMVHSKPEDVERAKRPQATPEDDEPLPKSPKKEPRSTPKSATKQGSRVLTDLTNGKKDKCEKSDDKDRLKVKPEAKASEASKSSNSEAEAKVSEEEDKKKNKLETEPTKTEVNSEVCKPQGHLVHSFSCW